MGSYAIILKEIIDNINWEQIRDIKYEIKFEIHCRLKYSRTNVGFSGKRKCRAE